MKDGQDFNGLNNFDMLQILTSIIQLTTGIQFGVHKSYAHLRGNTKIRFQSLKEVLIVRVILYTINKEEKGGIYTGLRTIGIDFMNYVLELLGKVL